MEALVLSTAQKTAVIKRISIPSPGPSELQIKVIAVALNPVDALYTANPLGTTGRIVGSDFAGVVTARGPNASHIKLNQRVAGFLQGACSVNDRPGAFAEYLVVPCDLVWLVPDSIPLNEAAAVSLCALTAAQALYLRLGLPAPFPVDGGDDSGEAEVAHPEGEEADDERVLHVIIYGASTSVALYAAQLVHEASAASGVPISLYGVASRKHHEKLSKFPYRYTGVVDYNDKNWPDEIRGLSSRKAMDLAFDCISEGDSVTLVASTLHRRGKLAVVRSREGGAWSSDKVNLPSEPLYGAVWEGLGERVEYQGFTIPASPEARKFAVEFYSYLSDSPLLPNPVRLMPGGFRSIPKDGFALLGSGTMGERTVSRDEEWMKPVRGEKLVYEVGST